MSPSVNNRVQQRVLEELEKIEKEEDVKIFYACESVVVPGVLSLKIAIMM